MDEEKKEAAAGEGTTGEAGRNFTNAPAAWLSTAEAAKYLGISDPTLFRWIRDRRVISYKVGNATRFKREDLDALVERRQTRRMIAEAPEKCDQCGSKALTTGAVRGSGPFNTYFFPDNAKFLTVNTSEVEVKAYVCLECGHIMMRADLKKLHRLLKEKELAPLDENAPPKQE